MKNAAFALACSIALASCTHDHTVKVSLVGGDALFTFAPAASVTALTVTAVSEPSHLAWKLEATGPNGPDLNNLRFGEVPPGLRQSATPEKLKVGQLYRVTLFASDGGGIGYFIIPGTDIARGSLTLLR